MRKHLQARMFFRRYQLGRHWQGTRLSLALILTYLEPMAVNALDVGSNEGVVSSALAWQGLEVTGIERNPQSLAIADILSKRLKARVSFVSGSVTLAELRKMESVDVSLMLSVHHQLVASEGLDYANEVLRELAQKTRRQMFFQPAAIQRKYRQAMPFRDNDFYSITEYYADVLANVFPHHALIGYSPNDLPPSEPFRPMILFSHTPIQPQSGRDVVGIMNEISRASVYTHPIVHGLRKLRSG